jgi:hypothetical protein
MMATAVLGGGVTFGGCSLHQDGVRPPDNRIFFPGGATIEGAGPGLGRWLYVVNSNSDLRYNAGTIVAVDLIAARNDYQAVGADGLTAWGICSNPDTRYVPPANVAEAERCCWDILDQNILNCDEQKYIRRERSVRIGSFGGRPVTQQLHRASGGERLFVPVRGDVAIDMIEVGATADDVTFLCTGARANPDNPPARFAICDPNWRITRRDDPLNTTSTVNIPDDQVLRLPDEPYALAVDDGLELLYVGHLRGGSVSLINLGSGIGEKAPELLNVYPGLVPPDANGSQGVTSLTIREKTGCSGPVYVSSRYSPVVGSFVIAGLDNSSCNPGNPNGPPGDRSIAIVGTGQIMSTGLSGAETRGIEFVSAGQDAAGQPLGADRAFILQRTPPALVAIDVATQVPFATIEVCQSPTNLVKQTDAAGRTVALFVTCFDAGEVYVIDPWTPRVRTVIPIGRGPVATVLPPAGAAPSEATRAYVVGFGANNVAVVDLDPNSRTQYRVIQRIGFPSPTPREVGPQ